MASAGSGALKTALTTATASAPARIAAARFAAVMPPMPTSGRASGRWRRASASSGGPAGSASGLVAVGKSEPKPT